MLLEDFARDQDAIENGIWQAPGPEFGSLELKVQGYHDRYTDRLHALQEETARKARVDGVLKPREGWDHLPLTFRLRVMDDLILDMLLLDVRGIDVRPGEAMTVEQYRLAAREPRYVRLMQAVKAACEAVTSRRAGRTEDAAGN